MMLRDIAAHRAAARRQGTTENFSPQSENFNTGVRAPSHYSELQAWALWHRR
jgi:hypothetical protein